jgi:acyl carrier protein
MPRGRDEIAATVHTLVGRIKRDREFTLDTPLYGEGLDMDSLEAAELSALLEDELGTDPYTEGIIPYTVGEIVDFYAERLQSDVAL